jgi:hypothetical protein
MGTPSCRLCDAILKLINLLWIKRKMTGAEKDIIIMGGVVSPFFREIRKMET